MYLLPTIVVASVIVLLYAISLEHQPPAYVVDTRTNVSYQGLSVDRVDSFLGIHYGQDTGGAGRFAPPKPFIPARNSVINATVAGAACPQQPVPFPGINSLLENVTNISEDCLTLRVARPAGISKHSNLPVVVFIYGGGFEIGQAYDNVYQPDQLILNSVKNGSPVIYVAMNYRLGSKNSCPMQL
jgi:carboxylesterase type B